MISEICVIIAFGNVRRQAINWNNADLLLTVHLEKCNENLNKIKED